MIDWLSWRWSFFLLVPIGLCGTLLSLAGLKRRPSASHAQKVAIDYLGATLLVATTTTLVLILDRRMQEIIGPHLRIVLAALFSFVTKAARRPETAEQFRSARLPGPLPNARAVQRYRVRGKQPGARNETQKLPRPDKNGFGEK